MAVARYDEVWRQPVSPGFRVEVGANHRTVTTYLNALAEGRCSRVE